MSDMKHYLALLRIQREQPRVMLSSSHPTDLELPASRHSQISVTSIQMFYLLTITTKFINRLKLCKNNHLEKWILIFTRAEC